MHVDIQYLVNINPISSPPLTARDAPQRPATMAEDEVEKVRLEGNAAFKAGNFAEALEKYSAAIALAPENHLLYSNRSLAHHSAGDFEAAIAARRLRASRCSCATRERPSRSWRR